MTEWTRAKLPTICGQCGKTVDVGEPLLVIAIAGVKRERYRCAQFVCCESPVPVDLPPLEELPAPRRTGNPEPLLPLAQAFFERMGARK